MEIRITKEQLKAGKYPEITTTAITNLQAKAIAKIIYQMLNQENANNRKDVA